VLQVDVAPVEAIRGDGEKIQRVVCSGAKEPSSTISAPTGRAMNGMT
jgi:hypothetical protein